MKFCNQDISKTILARSFKLGQLIEDNEWFNWFCFVASTAKVSSPNHFFPGNALTSG